MLRRLAEFPIDRIFALLEHNAKRGLGGECCDPANGDDDLASQMSLKQHGPLGDLPQVAVKRVAPPHHERVGKRQRTTAPPVRRLWLERACYALLSSVPSPVPT